jgi:hypothetical protein
MYLLELQSVKGCKALRHRFPFCGIESFSNSSSFFLSLYVVAPSLVSFFLFLSFYFSLAARCSKCFCNHPLERERWNFILYKIKMEALGSTDISLTQTQARERKRERERSSRFSSFLPPFYSPTNNSFYLFIYYLFLLFVKEN